MPVQYQVLFANCVALFYNMFLSYIASKWSKKYKYIKKRANILMTIMLCSFRSIAD